eukprot:COSAG01_NODE_1628_length_9684_cov_9.777673_1_plen_339_part_00
MLKLMRLTPALPPEVVAQLGSNMHASEIEDCIMLLKDDKAPDSLGAIAELLKENSSQWACLLEISFNAAFRKGELSVAQRFGIMSLLFKKNDKTDLQYYRSLAMTSQLYKLIGLVISERWKKVLASQLFEDQHGFVYNRVIIENLFKINDAGAHMDMTADAEIQKRAEETNKTSQPDDDWMYEYTSAHYMCDRLKAFDRVGFLFVVRVAGAMCGVYIPVPEKCLKYWKGRQALLLKWDLDMYGIQTEEVERNITNAIGEPPDVLQCLHELKETPDAVRWISYLLSSSSGYMGPRSMECNSGRNRQLHTTSGRLSWTRGPQWWGRGCHEALVLWTGSRK